MARRPAPRQSRLRAWLSGLARYPARLCCVSVGSAGMLPNRASHPIGKEGFARNGERGGHRRGSLWSRALPTVRETRLRSTPLPWPSGSVVCRDFRVLLMPPQNSAFAGAFRRWHRYDRIGRASRTTRLTEAQLSLMSLRQLYTRAPRDVPLSNRQHADELTPRQPYIRGPRATKRYVVRVLLDCRHRKQDSHYQ